MSLCKACGADAVASSRCAKCAVKHSAYRQGYEDALLRLRVRLAKNRQDVDDRINAAHSAPGEGPVAAGIDYVAWTAAKVLLDDHLQNVDDLLKSEVTK